MTSPSRTVLLVDADPHLLDALGTLLCGRGYRVLFAPDGNVAADLIDGKLPDVVVLDMMLRGRSGFQIAHLVKERSDGRVPVVMTAANTSTAHRDYAFAVGVDRFLVWPVPLAAVLEAVEALCPPRPTARINESGTAFWPTAMPA